MANSNHDADLAARLRSTARRTNRGDGSSPRRLTAIESAQRNAATFVHGAAWHWPRWLDRQTRASHPAFVPQGELGLLENLTGRAFGTLGTVGAGPLVEVDPSGYATPHRGQWGIDWLVRGESRWHVPAHEPGVRQRLVDDAPVIETAIRVGTGDVVQRIYCVAGERDAGDLVVVEFDNQTPLPVAVAIAVRPFDALGVGVVDAIEFDGVRCRVNEQPALVLPKPPSAYAVGSFDMGDSLGMVAADVAAAEPPRRVTCAQGLANAAVVFPLAHRTSLHLLLAPRAPRRSHPRPPERPVDAGSIGRGWAVHARRAAVPVFVSEAHERAYQCAVRRLLLTVDGSGIADSPGLDPLSVTDEARLVGALVRLGLSRIVAPVLVARFQESQLDSWARRDEPTVARNLAALAALGAHWTQTRDVSVGSACLASAVRLLQWCVRRVERGDGADRWPELARAAHRLADLADESDQPSAAADLRALVPLVRWHGERGVERAAAEPGPAARPAVAAGEIFIRSPRGIELARAADEVVALATAADAAAVEALDELAGHQGTTGAWPTVVHPRTGAGSAGGGDDPFVAAGFVEASLALTVHERLPDDPLSHEAVEIHLLPVASSRWRGRPIDVRNVQLASGVLSFAIRWHGDRPALLWELHSKHGAAAPIRVRCPGLDPAFETDRRSGEALLAPWVEPASGASDAATDPTQGSSPVI